MSINETFRGFDVPSYMTIKDSMDGLRRKTCIELADDNLIDLLELKTFLINSLDADLYYALSEGVEYPALPGERFRMDDKSIILVSSTFASVGLGALTSDIPVESFGKYGPHTVIFKTPSEFMSFYLWIMAEFKSISLPTGSKKEEISKSTTIEQALSIYRS